MKRAVETVFDFGPMIFALGFLWPFLAELLMRAGVGHAWAIGAVVALGLGTVAQVRGRWV